MSSAIQVAKTATYLPELVEVQRGSFKWFLEKGLIEELDSFSPITDYTGKLELHFVGTEYRLKRPRHDVEEAKRRDATFASQMYVTCRLVNKETGEIKEQEVFIGELPLMTERGTFVINGAERVIVNQIVLFIYFRINTFELGKITVMVRTQVGDKMTIVQIYYKDVVNFCRSALLQGTGRSGSLTDL